MPYASKYYDPEKAHEYYMRTRELKGYENRYGGSRGDGTSAASGMPVTNTATTSTSKTSSSGSTSSSASTSSSTNSSTTFVKQDNPYSTKVQDLQGQIDTINLYKSDVIAFQKNQLQHHIDHTRDQIAKDPEFEKVYLRGLKKTAQNIQAIINKVKNESNAKLLKLKEELKIAKRKEKEFAKEQKEKERQYKQEERKRAQEAKQKEREEKAAQKQKEKEEKAAQKQTDYEAKIYIKNQMDEERDETIKKVNKSVDNDMLSEAKRFASDLQRRRQNGEKIDNKKVLSQLKAMSGRAKKSKIKHKQRYMNEYRTRYQEELQRYYNSR